LNILSSAAAAVVEVDTSLCLIQHQQQTLSRPVAVAVVLVERLVDQPFFPKELIR
jgi:hypothetical protein